MITIHVPHPERAAVTRRLVELAGGDSRAITSSTAGLIVADAVALAYLSNGHTPNSRASKPAPTGVAIAVREAEVRAGLADDTRAPSNGSGARATRTRKTAAAAPSEE